MKVSASARAAAAYSAIVGRVLLGVGGSARWAGSSDWCLSRRRRIGPRGLGCGVAVAILQERMVLCLLWIRSVLQCCDVAT